MKQVKNQRFESMIKCELTEIKLDIKDSKQTHHEVNSLYPENKRGQKFLFSQNINQYENKKLKASFMKSLQLSLQ